MIDLILKPHGTYEYHWERTESGWNEILLNSEIADKTGIDPAGVRNNLKLLKDRGLAENRASVIKKARGRFLVEWKRSVEVLP